jgi:hypothetical protein
MNPDEFSIPSRRVFLKKSAYSAVATTFAFSAASVLTSCQTTFTLEYRGYLQDCYWSGGPVPSNVGPLVISESSGGTTATNTSDQPVTITGPDGQSTTLQPGETRQLQE